MRLIFSIIFGLAVMFKVATASAMPIVSVDMDTGTAGIQNSLNVSQGSSFTVGVFVSGITDDVFNPFDGLNAFEFDVDFDSSIVSATSVASGGYLGLFFPAGTAFLVESDIASPDVNYAETTLGVWDFFGDGFLALITFDADNPGTSVLDLNDVILSMPFGFQIAPVDLSNGTVTVTGQAPIPEPGTLLLLGIGLAGLVGYGSRRRLKGRSSLLHEKSNT